MWIAVREGVLREQRAHGIELLQHSDVRGRGALLRQVVDTLQGGQADEIGGDAAIVEEAAVIADGTVDF